MTELLTNSPLGQKSPRPETYDATLLFPIERKANRDRISNPGNPLPFTGHDTWNAFELSWLNNRGKPQIATAQFTFCADSPRLIESKSFKLYLNSFNNMRIKDQNKLVTILTKDLSAACCAPVDVAINPNALQKFGNLPGLCLDNLDVACDGYQPDVNLLKGHDGPEIEQIFHSHLLKSNCPVTQQPDWGSVLIRCLAKPMDERALLQYLVSFRDHNDFHEHCIETIFIDLFNTYSPKALAVNGFYVRRGGLDINPSRHFGYFNTPTPDAKNLRLIRQ